MITSVFLVADGIFIGKCLAQIQVHNAADLHEAFSLALPAPCILLKDSTWCQDILLGNERRLLCRAGILRCCRGSCTGESTYSKHIAQTQACCLTRRMVLSSELYNAGPPEARDMSTAVDTGLVQQVVAYRASPVVQLR